MIKYFAWAALLLLAASPVAYSETGLEAFEARYRVIANHVPTGITAVTSLSPGKEQAWNMKFEIDSFIVKLHEEVNFQWGNCYSRPQDYVFQFSGFGLRRKFENQFNWEKMEAVSTKKKEQKIFQLSPITSDPLSFSMMAVCDLRRGKKHLNYHIAYTGGVYHYKLEVEEDEMLETPAGTFNTTRISRIYKDKYPRTTMWVAKDLDYFLVKMEHVESKFLSGAIELKGLERGNLSIQQQETSPSEGEE